jgi:translation initiation factor IF-3
LLLAEGKDLDLVCVNDKIDPPICKILDFKKLEYQRKKAQKDNEKRSRANEVDTKTITFKSGIAEHDLAIKEKQINEFLKKNAIVEIIIKLMGREAYSDTL